MYRSHREVWISVKRGMSFALSGGFAPVAFVIQEVWMGKRTLSLYIDESGLLM